MKKAKNTYWLDSTKAPRRRKLNRLWSVARSRGFNTLHEISDATGLSYHRVYGWKNKKETPCAASMQDVEAALQLLLAMTPLSAPEAKRVAAKQATVADAAREAHRHAAAREKDEQKIVDSKTSFFLTDEQADSVLERVTRALGSNPDHVERGVWKKATAALHLGLKDMPS
jgi:hypothetical protein